MCSLVKLSTNAAVVALRKNDPQTVKVLATAKLTRMFCVSRTLILFNSKCQQQQTDQHRQVGGASGSQVSSDVIVILQVGYSWLKQNSLKWSENLNVVLE